MSEKAKRFLRLSFLLFFLIFAFAYLISSRVRKHISFNIDQLEILIALRDQESIHKSYQSNGAIVNDSTVSKLVLHELSKMNGVGSQRLIYAYHEHLDINYKLFSFFGLHSKFMFPDLGSPLNQSVLSKTHNFYPFGLGGIQLRPSVLIKFKNTKDLDKYLNELVKKYTIQKLIESNGDLFRVEIEPLLFIDWYWYPVGINPAIILNYSDVDSSNVDEAIINSRINGVFGPNIDFNSNIDANYLGILDFTNRFVDNGKMTFAKHFGYRRENRVSVSGTSVDPHWAMVRVTTSEEAFLNEDLRIHQKLMNDVNNSNLGVMIGHHILDPVDSINLASLSPEVIGLVNKTLKGITISDSIGMYGFLSAGEFSDLISRIKTDLILLSYFDFEKMQAIKNVISSNSGFSSSEIVKKIIDRKREMGLVKVFKISLP